MVPRLVEHHHGYTHTDIAYRYTEEREWQPAMKQKLTITVDAELLPIAKRYARSRGVSLSSLVEQSLREMAGESTQSFASLWRGKFRMARQVPGGRA